jgi:hypothetical protein
MSEEITAKDIVKVVEQTADIRVQTAQVRMLTEIYKLANTGGDIRAKLRQYIADKEKELGCE